MREQELNISLEKIAETYEHVMVDTSVVFPGIRIASNEINLKNLIHFKERANEFREALGKSRNLFFSKGVEKEITMLVNKFKYYRRKSKKNSDERVLLKELTDNLVLTRKRIRKRILREVYEEIYNPLLFLLDEISAYIGERFPRFDIRKKNSKTDEEVIACAYTLSLQNRRNTAIVSSDKGIREVCNIMGKTLVMERFNPYNYDLVDSLMYDAPVGAYKREGECYRRASEIILDGLIDYEELADSLSFEGIVKLSKVVPGRGFVKFPELNEREMDETRRICNQDALGRKQMGVEAS